jgi:pimeloyl-ACP methyl ester carboxylesterase
VSIPRRPQSHVVFDSIPAEHAEIDGLEIAYRLRPGGARPPVLILHGFTGNGADWGTVCDRLHAAGHPTLSVDHPGHGDSAAPDDPATYAMEALADAHHALAARLGLLPLVAFGHSMGAAVAEELAIRHADDVAALVLADSAGGSRKPAWVRALDGYGKEKLRTIAFERGMEALYDYQIESGRRVVEHIPVELRPLIRAHFALTSPVGYFHAAAAMRDRRDTLNDLASLRNPTLIVCGAGEDRDFLDGSRELHRTIAGSRLELIDGAAHNPQFEAPGRLADLLLAFLEEAIV